MTNIQPLGDRVLIEPLEEDTTKTEAGIYLPENVSKERPQKGKILAVGPGKVLESGEVRPMSVKVGDEVLFSKYGPTEVKIDGKDLLIGSESDLLVVVS